MTSTSREENDLYLQFSHLIPEYSNICVSGLRQSKQAQERDKKIDGEPKVFGLISLFSYVAISSTKFILTETASFTAKLKHHEERDN